MRWRPIVVVLLLLVVAAVGALQHIVTGIARDNLDSSGFSRTYSATPATLGLASTDVTIPSDGRLLVGWWIPGDAGGPTAILVHGLGSNMSKPLQQWAPNLHSGGLNVLTFDLRNHGASPSTPDRRVTYGVDEARDVLAAVAFVRDNADTLQADPDRIVLYGGSMGAATALLAGAQHPDGVVAVLADSSFASLGFQAHIDGREQGYPSFVVAMVLGTMDGLAPSPPSHSRPDRAIADLDVPVFLAHCQDDTRVQVASFDRLRSLAPAAVTWTGPCAGGPHPEHHVDGYAMPGYNATVLGFLSRL